MGFAGVDIGHSRVPEPPERITGTIVREVMVAPDRIALSYEIDSNDAIIASDNVINVTLDPTKRYLRESFFEIHLLLLGSMGRR